MKISDLPFPRLELRWSKIDGEKPYPSATYSYDNLCEYLLVISPPDKLDLRSNIEKENRTEYGARNIETEISKTTSSGRIINDDGSIHTPFRDGVHIIRDAKTLRLPAFVTFEDKAEPIDIWKDHTVSMNH